RQSTRPARACCQPPEAAAAALIAMFVPAAALGLPESRRMSGNLSVPRTRPTAAPRKPATNAPAKAAARSITSARGARLPERLVAARVRRAREDEEEIGEPVQVDERERAQVDVLRRRQRLALDTAADRARDVQARRRLRPAGQDEALQLGQAVVPFVARVLEPLDLRLLDTEPSLDVDGDAEVGAKVEELVLDALEQAAHRRVQIERGE